MLSKSLLLASLVLAIGCVNPPAGDRFAPSAASPEVTKQEADKKIDQAAIDDIQKKLLEAGCEFQKASEIILSCAKADLKTVTPLLKSYIGSIEVFMAKYDNKSLSANNARTILTEVTEKELESKKAEVSKTFADHLASVLAPELRKSNQALLLSSTTADLPLYPYASCQATVDLVDSDIRAILVSFTNCANLFQGAPQLYQCTNGVVCEAVTSQLAGYTAYFPYGSSNGPVHSVYQSLYQVELGDRKLKLSRRLWNVGTANSVTPQEFVFILNNF